MKKGWKILVLLCIIIIFLYAIGMTAKYKDNSEPYLEPELKFINISGTFIAIDSIVKFSYDQNDYLYIWCDTNCFWYHKQRVNYRQFKLHNDKIDQIYDILTNYKRR